MSISPSRQAPKPLWQALDTKKKDYFSRNKRIKIAIIDSGVNPVHPHVQGVEKGLSFFRNDKNQIIQTNDYIDTIGHGTAIAGIIRKKAHFAKLYAIKIFYEKLATQVSVLMAALNWAIDNDMHIINLSLGTRQPEYKKDLMKICARAYKKNIFIVSSAKDHSDIIFPSVFKTVTGVYWNKECDETSFTYHPNSPIEFGAHGRPRPIPGLAQEDNFSGSSFAAAYMTGNIALKLKNDPHITVCNIRRFLG